ncbi:MAG: hypothetical protein ACI4TB_07625 [Lachnospiraceae bacterium]
MLSSKYVKDYRMDTEMTKSGKVKRKMIYTGPLYRWELSEEVLKKLRLRYLLLCVAGWIIFIGSMLFYSNLSRIWYVILPYACLLLVFSFFSAAVYNLFTAKQPMSREVKDKTFDRLKGSSLVGMVFCAGAFAGEVAARIVFQEFGGWGDGLFMAATILLFFILLYAFKEGKQLMVSEEINPVAEEWKDK